MKTTLLAIASLSLSLSACIEHGPAPAATELREPTVLPAPTPTVPLAADDDHPDSAETGPCAPEAAMRLADAVAGQAKLRGQQISVRGKLRTDNHGCTEAVCGNSCRFEIALHDASAPSRGRGKDDVIRLREAGATDYSLGPRFECTASAGDPCTGTEPADATDPPCDDDLPRGEVIVTGKLVAPIDLGHTCDPPCKDPRRDPGFGDWWHLMLVDAEVCAVAG